MTDWISTLPQCDDALVPTRSESPTASDSLFDDDAFGPYALGVGAGELSAMPARLSTMPMKEEEVGVGGAMSSMPMPMVDGVVKNKMWTTVLKRVQSMRI